MLVRILPLYLALFLAVFSSSVDARIYKWVDENGQVQYSQSPPPAHNKTKASDVSVMNIGHDPTNVADLTDGDRQYCSNVRKFSFQVAIAMRKGYSSADVVGATAGINQRVMKALDTSEPIVKQIIYEVYGYKYGKVSPTQVGNLIYKKCVNGSYRVKPKGDRVRRAGASSGTGWVHGSGLVVTNYHVVTTHKNISVVLNNGYELKAHTVHADKSNDIALLRVDDPSRLPDGIPTAVGTSGIGTEVFTIGYPHPDIMGSKPKLTQGVISSTTGIKDDPRTYQISVPVQSGNSGGPLIDYNGNVVGIVSAKLSAVQMVNQTGDLPQNVNYAIKINYLNSLLHQHQLSGVQTPLVKVNSKSLAGIAQTVEKSVLQVIAN